MSSKYRSSEQPSDAQRGSALVMAVFMLVLLTGMGAALLFLSRSETLMSQSSVRSKRAFYFAEAGLEHARSDLWDVNRNGPFQDDLEGVAGLDGSIDFDPNTVEAIFDGDGNPVGFTGYGDDDPLYTIQTLDGGIYSAFLTNDPIEGRDQTTDADDRIHLIGVGAGPNYSFEIVEAVIQIDEFLPTLPPATITLLGPAPFFGSANSAVKDYIGDDCAGAGVPGLFVPIVGTIGSAAELSAEAGIEANPDFVSGPYTDEDTFADLTDAGNEETLLENIDSDWTDCNFLAGMIDGMRIVADTICADATRLNTTCPTVAPSPSRIVFADGDFTVGPDTEAGTLVVTGELVISGNTDWAGLILVVGEGQFRMNGAGNGVITGGIVVADIAGPDNIYGTADDCTGPDNGFDQAVYDERGGGNSGTIYCSTVLDSVSPAPPYEILEFRQH